MEGDNGVAIRVSLNAMSNALCAKAEAECRAERADQLRRTWRFAAYVLLAIVLLMAATMNDVCAQPAPRPVSVTCWAVQSDGSREPIWHERGESFRYERRPEGVIVFVRQDEFEVGYLLRANDWCVSSGSSDDD